MASEIVKGDGARSPFAADISAVRLARFAALLSIGMSIYGNRLLIDIVAWFDRSFAVSHFYFLQAISSIPGYAAAAFLAYLSLRVGREQRSRITPILAWIGIILGICLCLGILVLAVGCIGWSSGLTQLN